MLRLWPERYVLSLFPGQSWLRVGKGMHDARPPRDDWHNGGLHSTADRLLSAAPVREMWRPALDVIVSDEMARLVVVPWQDRLPTSSQQLSYAEACLADSGVALDARWLVQSGFRRYGSAGLALAMRHDFIEGLVATAAAHRLRLRSLLPASAAAYWRYGGQSSARNSLLLLCEDQRVTGMRYRGRALDAIDVQPTGGDERQAIRRLLRRQYAASALHSVVFWSADDKLVLAQSMADELPAAKSEQLPRAFLE